MLNMSMLPLLSLSQLEHKAVCEDNALALAILSCLENEVEQAVEAATTTNDADYSYTVWDAVQAVESLYKAEWFKVEETKQTKDRIIYQIKGLHEDTSSYNNHVVLYKYKGSDTWHLNAYGGEYGEDLKEERIVAKGFKDAQEKATAQLIDRIKRGFELNME